MGARIVHFGSDTCHRMPVLKSAGYSINDCRSLAQLHYALQICAEADAVVMTEPDRVAPDSAISIARSSSTAPLILFPGRRLEYKESDFDLVVPALTPPEQWLSDIAALIQRSQAIRAQSQSLVDQSSLRREAEAARKKSRLERERSRRECARNAEMLGRDPQKPRSDEELP